MSIFRPFCAGSYNPANFIVDDSISLFISISELDWTDNAVLVFRLLLAFIFEVEFSLLMMSFFSIFHISMGSLAKEQVQKKTIQKTPCTLNYNVIRDTYQEARRRLDFVRRAI